MTYTGNLSCYVTHPNGTLQNHLPLKRIDVNNVKLKNSLARPTTISVKFSDRMGLFLEDLSFNKHLVYVFQRLNIESDDWVDDASNKTNQTYIHAQSSCIKLIS